VAFHARRKRRGSRSSARKTHWTWQGQRTSGIELQTADEFSQPPEYVSVWMRWPSGFTDPQTDHPMPSDETLVRTIQNVIIGVNLGSLITGAIPTLHACWGLIAHDAGHDPTSYDGIVWNTTDIGAPPHPILDADMDWVHRVPAMFVADKTFQGPAVESFVQSRAMRKLPPGTGILGVFGGITIGATVDVIRTFDLGIDCRMAFRSGYTQ